MKSTHGTQVSEKRKTYIKQDVQPRWCICFGDKVTFWTIRCLSKRFLSAPERPYLLEALHSIVFTGTKKFFPGGKTTGVWSWPVFFIHCLNQKQVGLYLQSPCVPVMYRNNFPLPSQKEIRVNSEFQSKRPFTNTHIQDNVLQKEKSFWKDL